MHALATGALRKRRSASKMSCQDSQQHACEMPYVMHAFEQLHNLCVWINHVFQYWSSRSAPLELQIEAVRACAAGSKNASVHKGSAAFKEGLLLPDNFESTERAPSESAVLDVIDTVGAMRIC
eukprot:6209241-Pleurochrysis_carterae.AAC.1